MTAPPMARAESVTGSNWVPGDTFNTRNAEREAGAVTDSDCAQTATVNTRNARIAALMAEERAAMRRRAVVAASNGVGHLLGRDDPDDERLVRTRAEKTLVWEAAKYARWCCECGRDIAPGETVVRRRRYGAMRDGGGVYIYCEDCGPKGYPLKPCAHCGRGVHLIFVERWMLVDSSVRRLAQLPFCCDRCAAQYWNEPRKQRRAEARASLRCQECAEVIDAGRSDAKYCSSACRQRAYRARKP